MDIVNAKFSTEQLKLMLEIEKAKREAARANTKTAIANARASIANSKASIANSKAEQENAKAEQEKQKAIQLGLLCKRRATCEDEGRKRIKTDSQENVTISDEHLDSLYSSLTNSSYYQLNVEGNIHRFDITNILHNYNDVNQAMINVIKENFNQFESVENIRKDQIQTTFNTLLSDLLSQFNNSTSLKYLDTHSKRYLKLKRSDDILFSKFSDDILSSKAPDCSFIYKNVNINVQDEHESLQDFVVCIGELKSSGMLTEINGRDSVGQLMCYLACILKVQQRRKVYGFITNIDYIRFYYAEQDNQSIVYYQSDNFEMFNYSSETTTRSYNDQTLKLFIKFLTMETNFYGYTTLNINTNDYLYDDKFYIKMRSGHGATSFVYLLANTCNNQLANNPKCSIIKISKHEEDSRCFLNEVNILKKLKKSNYLNNFDLFFPNVFSSSPTGKFIFFEERLDKLESLTLSQSIQLINAVEYLYNCYIIHRDIRPDNIMFNSNTKHIKLIDFGFAKKFETNEITKELTIEGTISFGSLKFLKFYSEISFDSLFNPQYEYERTFDLYCSLNVIMIMTNEYIKNQYYEIKHKQLQTTHQKIILAMHKFWFDLKVRNKDYSKLLKLFDNLKEPQDFQSIENILKELVKWDD